MGRHQFSLIPAGPSISSKGEPGPVTGATMFFRCRRHIRQPWIVKRVSLSPNQERSDEQDTFLRWRKADRDLIDNPAAWLTTACRKLVSRARASVGSPATRYAAPPERQEALLTAFRSALVTGETGGFATMLADDVALCADGGGKVPTLQGTLRGKGTVLDFIMGSLRGYWSTYEWRPADINGGRGVLLVSGDGRVGASVTFGYDEDGQLADIYIVRNPDKLAGLNHAQAWLA